MGRGVDLDELDTSRHRARRGSGRLSPVILGGYVIFGSYSNQSQTTPSEHHEVLAGPVWGEPESPNSMPETARSRRSARSGRTGCDTARSRPAGSPRIGSCPPARWCMSVTDQERLALQPPSTPGDRLISQSRVPKYARRRLARRSSKRSTAHRIASHGPQPRRRRSPAVGRERLYPNRETKQVSTSSISSFLSRR